MNNHLTPRKAQSEQEAQYIRSALTMYDKAMAYSNIQQAKKNLVRDYVIMGIIFTIGMVTIASIILTSIH